MKLLLKKTKVNTLYLAALLAILISAKYFSSLYFNFGSDDTICVFKNVFGIACPGCGMGRATVSLMHGDLKSALLFNPFSILLIIVCAWLLFDIFTQKKSFLQLVKRKFSIAEQIILYFLLSANWIWNIIKY